MTQPAVIESPARARLGVTGFIISLVPVLWVAATFWLIMVSAGDDGFVVELSRIMMFASLAVVPLFAILALALAILALLVNRPLGKVFGVLTIIVVLAEFVVIVLQFAGLLELPAQALG